MEYCGIKSGVCNNAELFCKTHCYGDSRSQTGCKNCSNICYQSAQGTTCLNLEGGENCANRNCANDECVSRDSGFDFETDERMSMDFNSDVTMFEPHPQSFLKSQGQMPCEYNGGSLIKWRMKNMKRDDVENGNQDSVRNSLHWEDFFGSSIDLTPTLLGIYDKIASANENGDQGPPGDQPEFEYFVTNENLEDGSDDQCHSPKPSPQLSRKSNDQSKFRELIHNRPIGLKSECEDKYNNNKVRMDHEHKEPTDMNEDNKKRPLSISSMSSSSTSSLPRRRKRPNLSQYIESTSSSQLDIEKLDNLLYIDDNPETDVPERSADELSVSSEDKGKSGGDSDSQTSADHFMNDGDQSEHLDRERTMSLHQSDSSFSFTPANSANCSTADLSLNSDLKSAEISSEGDKVRRSPSRTSQKSSGMPRSASQKQQAHYVSFVQRVVTELVETERTYVLHLKDIKQGYYQHLAGSRTLNDTERECLFGNIMEIYNFSCHFLAELEDCGMDPIKVAECFVKNSEGFVIYADYCTNYPSAVAVLTKVMRDPQLNAVFKQRQLALGHSLPLGAYLLKPVQRVLKYHLLLQNVLKHYSKTDPGHDKLVAALDHMTNMSHQINEMKRKHEHAVRVQEIQSQLEDYEGEDFTRLGELVLEGSFRMFGVKASRQMFLFDKGVIIAKRKEDGMLSCKAIIPCNKLMLVESIPREPLNFQILPFDNPKGAHIIHARNLDQKRKWCQEIKRLMVESYSSKIPDNVKDLIIEKLGKSKEDDLIQAGSADTGKSHVTTPDYLEKRLRARRKSGPALITEILRPQKNRRAQGKNRSESPGPKPPTLESMMYAKNKDSDQYSYRTLSGLVRGSKVSKQQENQENLSPNRAAKRPVSIQRSQSFQNSSRNSLPVETYLKEKSNTDSLSMDNLSQSDGPAIRTNSFRMATRISPIRIDSLDGAKILQTEADEEDVQLRGENPKHLDNIRESVRKSLDEIDGSESKAEQYFSEKKMNGEVQNLNGSYLDELSSPKRLRYASMPVLNTMPPSSPRLSRLTSDRNTYSPTMNHIPTTSIHHARKIDIKPYFSYSRDKINQMSSPDRNGDKSRGMNSLAKDQKHVNAFHDTFSHLRKSQENICDKSGVQKPLCLTRPKPFTSTLKNSASLLQSQARLNKWGQERFTKGSMSDLTHLREDPWVPNKQRSYTESRVTLDSKRTKSPKEERSASKLENRQVGRFSLDVDNTRHMRTQSFNGDDGSASKENLDWIVYANRNSIPVSGLAGEEVSRKYKYCTPPRGSMEPPPYSKHLVGDIAKTPLHQNLVASHSTPFSSSASHSSNHGSGKEADVSTGDSTMSLSVTNTSSETCSSPDILKDAVFDDNSSAEKFFPRDRSQVSRSFSSPEPKRSHKFKRQSQEDRPASADILGDVNHIEESEKLVAEMEHYLKRSTSSSGSISSSNSKFPTCIPSFEKKVENRNLNRDSCISTGSASSYESTGDFSAERQPEEGIVDSIKSKISSITSKFTGKKLLMSESHLSNMNETSPHHTPKYNQEDHPNKISHNFSLRLKQGNQKSGEPDLPSLLREMEQGSEAIGSRMANTDLDDYATFSLPRTQETETTKSKQEPRRLHYGRFSTANLTGPKLNQITASGSKFQSQSESKLYHPVANLKNVAQSDSAFSIQSADIDSSSTEDSPRNGESQGQTENMKGPSETIGPDNFYERRLSAVFNSDEAFRDSAVYCDDIDSPPTTSHTESPLSPKPSIKNFVHLLEEKNKQKVPPPVKVRQKEPSAIIKQRMESLAAHSEYRNKSSSTSRSISTATSRTHSRCSSRASSEEKQLTGSALREYIDSKFPMKLEKETVDDSAFRSRSNSASGGKLKAAFSTGRLDILSMDVDNLVIMKGWVKELVQKFQDQK